MNRFASLWLVLLLVAISIAWFVGCRDDVTVPYPPELIGKYTGLYTYVEITNGIDTIVDTTQVITFTFWTEEYQMMMDTGISEDDRVFCDVAGEYDIENRVELIQTDSNLTRRVCTFSHNPFGSFGLVIDPDTVRLLQSETSGGVTKVKYLRLAPIPTIQ